MRREHRYFVYILSNLSGMLYIGVTSRLRERILEHRAGKGSLYTAKYYCYRLVYVEEYQYVNEAIEQEKRLKKWGRRKKEWLIRTLNPEWKDMFDVIEE